ncbi:MAG: hypothetical protein JOY54_12765 [Acidobacteriaceae bacterium]|nr:hypothetical protein [Acidobacteriaceae bacterium]
MARTRPCFIAVLVLSLPIASQAQNQAPPQAEISNGPLRVKLYLPDAQTGYYRGTRFDWSGVIASLEYVGHNYYGPWFNKTDPDVIDFIFKGPDIIAGPCSAITGPVEEFSTNDKALGYDDAKPGGSFIKIGVGALRKPDDREYNPYRPYPIVDSGKRTVRTQSDSVAFTQQLTDPFSGYAYLYTKVVRLVKGKPEMVIEHRLKNIGRRRIETSVYDHNFLVLDHQPIGPDFVITLPFDIKTDNRFNPDLARVQGREFTYRKVLEGRDTFETSFSGFRHTPADYRISIENRKQGAGMTITGDRPLSRESLWSIRSVLAMEPFIDISIDPDKEFTWSYTYSYSVAR